ncbi:MAG: ABC transporter permease [Caldilineaceae bacterium]
MGEAAVSGPVSSPPGRAADRDGAWRRGLRTLFAPLVGALVGLGIGAVLIWLAGANPLEAYRAMLDGALGGRRQIVETLLKIGPLLIMGLGLTVAFRCQVWNIGGEGQYFMGALGAVLVGLWLQETASAWVVIPLMLAAGLLGGALWAGVAAWLKLRFGISEIISTIMLNFIAEYFVLFLARLPLKDPESFLPQSMQLVGPARMPTIYNRVHIGVLIALLLVPLIYVLLWRTPLGFKIRAIGSSQTVANYAGMNVVFGVAFALMFSGALAGLTGAIEVSALHSRLKDGISGGYGFTGILVALLGRLHPVGVLLAAVFFGILTVGVQSMHSIYGLPIALAQVLQGVIVLCVLVADVLARRWWRDA